MFRVAYPIQLVQTSGVSRHRRVPTGVDHPLTRYATYVQKGRQDTMDWDTLYCPNRGCSCYGRPFRQGWLVKNGTTRGQKQALCRACGRSIALNTGTAYFELDAAPTLFDTAIRALAEGNSLRATGRIVQTAKLVCETYGDAWIWLAFLCWQSQCANCLYGREWSGWAVGALAPPSVEHVRFIALLPNCKGGTEQWAMREGRSEGGASAARTGSIVTARSARLLLADRCGRRGRLRSRWPNRRRRGGGRARSCAGRGSIRRESARLASCASSCRATG